VFALDRLVRIGIGPQRDQLAAVARAGELLAQQVGRVFLREQARLEIQSGREAEVGVTRPRVTVDAAVLAALIGVDGLVKGRSGESLRAMMERARCSVTTVSGREWTSASVSRLRASVSKRPCGLSAAPRPLMLTGGLMSSI